ncbi:uncharacterized protein B0I36DRAFT_331402 [Microdochium trichocladiopsis]|uniref:Uncharacterized protein n=1 Tax=Microdochium trichocladiopsis TaxID=1682393 RepID=A0A9P8Y075_9PEZI|nr:uncharacterized protein B0I36DRAFT_331402 [Microdochium trichocladiopsis]KAH7024427.1 hypothetical protein B0I36DRAFT_331402 [Microdochium trichocladiopsis]
MEGYPEQPFAKHLESFMTPGASWRRMLVQQWPPITQVGVWQRDSFWTGSMKTTADLYACHLPRRQSDKTHQETSSSSDAELMTRYGVDGFLRMGLLYDLTTRHVLLENSNRMLYWTGMSAADREAFCSVEDIRLPPQPGTVTAFNTLLMGITTTTSDIEQRQVVREEFQAQRHRLATSAGLVMAITNFYGWCGTDFEDSNTLHFIETFVHPDTLRSFGQLEGRLEDRHFEKMFEWEGSFADDEDPDL